MESAGCVGQAFQPVILGSAIFGVLFCSLSTIPLMTGRDRLESLSYAAIQTCEGVLVMRRPAQYVETPGLRAFQALKCHPEAQPKDLREAILSSLPSRQIAPR